MRKISSNGTVLNILTSKDYNVPMVLLNHISVKKFIFGFWGFFLLSFGVIDYLIYHCFFRPQLQDYRVAQQRMKKLEKLLAVHNIRFVLESENQK